MDENVAYLRNLTKGYSRIEGVLGDEFKIDLDVSVGDRLRQRHASMTDAEKVEVVNRMADFLEDCCECGGSFRDKDHAEDCPHAG